jgi:hypothetical protein
MQFLYDISNFNVIIQQVTDPIYEAVYSLHEVVEEYNVAETEADELQLCGEGREVGKVMKLGGLGEVQVEVA